MKPISPSGTYAVKPWPSCLPGGFDPIDLHTVAFWQSKLGLRDPPKLTDLSQLARLIRSTFNHPPKESHE